MSWFTETMFINWLVEEIDCIALLQGKYQFSLIIRPIFQNIIETTDGFCVCHEVNRVSDAPVHHILSHKSPSWPS